MSKVLSVIKNIAIKIWEYLKQAKIEYLIIIGAIAIDLISKGIIQATMKEGETLVIIPNFLEFCFVYNKAAAFSFDFGLSSLVGQQGVATIFIIVTIISIFLFGFVLYHLRNRKLWARIAFALIIGGAIGNLYDRMAFSMVRDFVRIVYFGMDIPFLGGTSFAIFNIADSCLVIGVIMYIVYVLFMETKDREALEKAQKESETEQEKATEEQEEKLEDAEKEESVVEKLEPSGEQQ